MRNVGLAGAELKGEDLTAPDEAEEATAGDCASAPGGNGKGRGESRCDG